MGLMRLTAQELCASDAVRHHLGEIRILRRRQPLGEDRAQPETVVLTFGCVAAQDLRRQQLGRLGRGFEALALARPLPLPLLLVSVDARHCLATLGACVTLFPPAGPSMKNAAIPQYSVCFHAVNG